MRRASHGDVEFKWSNDVILYKELASVAESEKTLSSYSGIAGVAGFFVTQVDVNIEMIPFVSSAAPGGGALSPKMSPVKKPASQPKMALCCSIKLVAPVTLRNLFPVPLFYRLFLEMNKKFEVVDQGSIAAGLSLQPCVASAKRLGIQLKLQGYKWTDLIFLSEQYDPGLSGQNLSFAIDGAEASTMKSFLASKLQASLQTTKQRNGGMVAIAYCPYILIDKTELKLRVAQADEFFPVVTNNLPFRMISAPAKSERVEESKKPIKPNDGLNLTADGYNVVGPIRLSDSDG